MDEVVMVELTRLGMGRRMERDVWISCDDDVDAVAACCCCCCCCCSRSCLSVDDVDVDGVGSCEESTLLCDEGETWILEIASSSEWIFFSSAVVVGAPFGSNEV